MGYDAAPLCLVRGADQAPGLLSSWSEFAYQADLPPTSPQPDCAFLDLQVSKGSGWDFDLGSAGRNLVCPGPRAGAAIPSPFSVPTRFPGRSLQTLPMILVRQDQSGAPEKQPPCWGLDVPPGSLPTPSPLCAVLSECSCFSYLLMVCLWCSCTPCSRVSRWGLVHEELLVAVLGRGAKSCDVSPLCNFNFNMSRGKVLLCSSWTDPERIK